MIEANGTNSAGEKRVNAYAHAFVSNYPDRHIFNSSFSSHRHLASSLPGPLFTL